MSEGQVRPALKDRPYVRYRTVAQVFSVRSQKERLAGGRERGAPPGAEVVPRDRRLSTEHPVGLFADGTRRR